MDVTPTPGTPDPENPARSWQRLNCPRICGWEWAGYLPTELPVLAAAVKPIIDEHFRHEHPNEPRAD